MLPATPPMSEKPSSSLFLSPNSDSVLTSATCEDIREIYKFGPKMGSGKYGKVRIARHRQSKLKFAVKTISYHSVKDLEALETEISILQAMDHPNIIRLYEIYREPSCIHLVLELCTGGELFDQQYKFPEPVAKCLLRKLLSGIGYLHNKGICHRDLKAQNILFQGKDEVKIIDFGLSKHCTTQNMKSIVGTPYYVAPEVLKGQYSNCCDVWSLGVITFRMLTGCYPFDGENTYALLKNIASGKLNFPPHLWDPLSADARMLVQHMLERDVEKRFTALQCLEHPWLMDEEYMAVTPTSPRSKRNRLTSLEYFERMKDYRPPSSFSRLMLLTLIKLLTHSEIEQLGEKFRKIDERQEGMIDKNSLKKAFRDRGVELSEEEVGDIIKRADLEGKGKIGYSEFLLATLDSKILANQHVLTRLFQYFDVENEGVISIKGLKTAFDRVGKLISKEDLDKLYAGMPTENFKIDFQEFCVLLQNSSQDPRAIGDDSDKDASGGEKDICIDQEAEREEEEKDKTQPETPKQKNLLIFE